jgi:hypothetical protein
MFRPKEASRLINPTSPLYRESVLFIYAKFPKSTSVLENNKQLGISSKMMIRKKLDGTDNNEKEKETKSGETERGRSDLDALRRRGRILARR